MQSLNTLELLVEEVKQFNKRALEEYRDYLQYYPGKRLPSTQLLCKKDQVVSNPNWVLPGFNYCGPGSRGGVPTCAVDAACQRHDLLYANAPHLANARFENDLHNAIPLTWGESIVKHVGMALFGTREL